MKGFWSLNREDFGGHVWEIGLYLAGNGEPSRFLNCGMETREWIEEGEY